jgi:hypothetical protein
MRAGAPGSTIDRMAHIPVNHPLRPLYRVLALLTGAYVLLFGILGVVRTVGDDVLARDDVWVLGLRTNLAFSVVSVLFGAVIVAANAIGGRIEHLTNMTAAVLFMVTGMGMMALLETDANVLNFSMSTVIVSLVFGLLLLTAGLYDKSGTREEAAAEDAFRHAGEPELNVPIER